MINQFKELHNLTKDYISTLSVSIFTVCIVSILGQIYYSPISSLIIPSLMLFFLVNLNGIVENITKVKKTYIYLGMYFFLLIVALAYSIFIQSNQIILAIRFSTILSLIPLAFFVPDNDKYVKVFLFFVLIHSVVIIFISIFLTFSPDPKFAVDLRQYVSDKGIGDIYTYNGWFYRVQLKGNPLIPISLFVFTFYMKQEIKDYIKYAIILLSVIIAGNLAFWIASLTFAFIGIIMKYGLVILDFSKEQIRKFKYKFYILVSFIFLLVLSIGIIYIYQTIILKMESSIPTRLDQVFVLFMNLSVTTITLFFGQGLGNTVDVVTEYRDYTGAYYYELQVIYILNQFGILMFSLFLFLKIYLVENIFSDKYIILIYLSYILYAVTNPYMFDSTNILVIILLISLRKEIVKVT